MSGKVLKLGTRGSMLALWQANYVKGEIERKHPGVKVELVRIKTTGDKILDVPLAKVGGKGLFVKEIEEALLDGRIDLAVHSMKDVPTVIPDGLTIAVITEREDPRDVLVCPSGKGFRELPAGARVGTSSLRRQAQILALRPDLQVEPLRGNLDTRLRKVEEGLYDAVILASAGITRMGWQERVTEYLDVETMIPAIGQGALGIEVREDDDETMEYIRFLTHRETEIAVRAERAFLHRLEGGCQVPIAAHGRMGGGTLELNALVASVDGKRVVRGRKSGDPSRPEDLGRDLAEEILSRGGKEILEEVYSES
ncbi:MAG: hydroxymethylbilane synthase [Deltaproteobacteria bacterium]|nr:MAG: hydroxymethylbilane synthase [Deltaproteobacteria bacterium]